MADKETKRPKKHPRQTLTTRPGRQSEMQEQPASENPAHKATGKLKDRVAIITGADSGIGRATALAFAKEGADIAVVYLSEDEDAAETAQLIAEQDRRSILLSGDVGDENFCELVVNKVMEEFGKLNILVNNAGEQHPQKSIEDISAY